MRRGNVQKSGICTLLLLSGLHIIVVSAESPALIALTASASVKGLAVGAFKGGLFKYRCVPLNILAVLLGDSVGLLIASAVASVLIAPVIIIAAEGLVGLVGACFSLGFGAEAVFLLTVEAFGGYSSGGECRSALIPWTSCAEACLTGSAFVLFCLGCDLFAVLVYCRLCFVVSVLSQFFYLISN